MSGSRPLLAARTSSGEASKDGGNTSPGSSRPPGGRPKRTLIESACSACRRRKSRCDGLRPSCSRCQNLRTDCQYEAEEGESRWSALRRRNQVLEQERDQVRELFAFVQARPEAEAQEIFQRIRTSHYDDVFQLLRQLKEGVVGMPPQSNHVGPLQPSPVTTGVDRLPPIQTILNAPNHAGLPPSHLAHGQSMGSEDSKGGLIPELPPGLPPHYHAIEPSLRTHTHDIPCSGHIPSLSSEESTGSIGSTWLDPPKPYQTP